MFSFQKRVEASVTHLVGYDSKGTRIPIPGTYGGSGGLNQVRKQIRKSVASGRGRWICEFAAHKLAYRNDPRFAAVERVELITSTHRLNDYFKGDKKPLRQRVHGWAFVERK